MDTLISQMQGVSAQLETVSRATAATKKTADELKVSRRRTWKTITAIVLVTSLDIIATIIAISALNRVDSLVAQVICPTDALFLKSYTPSRAATYPGGLLAYQHDMHDIYTQYTITLDCAPRRGDPTGLTR